MGRNLISAVEGYIVITGELLGKGMRVIFKKKVERIESLRQRLYNHAECKKGLLCSKEVHEISKKLDTMIAKYMHSQLKHII